jgi:ribosomal protein S18 acetylase RimI-like enzyme
MKVTVLQSNEAAIRLYEAYGFCRIAEIRPLDEARKLFEEDRIRPRQETEEKDEA